MFGWFASKAAPSRRGGLARASILIALLVAGAAHAETRPEYQEAQRIGKELPLTAEDELKLAALEKANALAGAAAAKVASNYAFITTTTGSLVDMSAGTTQLLAANVDDTASALTNIGFEFYFQGLRFTQFSVNDNGVLRLGAVAQTAGPYQPLGQVNAPIITAWGADGRTHTTGRVHFRVDGSAPTRVLTVEWLNMQANFAAGGTPDLTYQVRLFEGSGDIEFIYGGMAMSATGAGQADSNDPHIGFSSTSGAGNIGTVTAPASGTPDPTFSGTAATAVANLYNTAGPIPVLNSAAQGSRRTFRFVPAPAQAPTALTFTAIAPASYTLNWVDSPNDLSYQIQRSLDGVNYMQVGTAAQNATSFNATSLSPSTNYFWRVIAVAEGGVSTPLEGSQATTPAGNVVSNVVTGLWSDPATWSGGVVPTSGDNVTISDGATVTIDTAANALSLVIGTGGAPATLVYEPAAARTLTVGTSVTVASNGSLSTAAAGTVLTHSLVVGTDLVNNGVLDFSTNGNAAGGSITFTGAATNTFTGNGVLTDIRAITVNKGTASANVLLMNPATLTVRGAVIDNNGFLTLTNGTLRIGGNYGLSSRVFLAATYVIPATAGLWLDNPNFVVSATSSGTSTANNGLFRLSQGTYNVGLAGGDGFGGGAGAQFIIEGGTLNAPRVDPQGAVSWNQTGGVVNIGVPVANTRSNFGAFELFSTTSTFNFTGGTINLVQASVAGTPIDYNVRSGTVNVAGGQLNVGTAATATNFNFRLRGNVPSFAIDNTGTPKAAQATAQVNLRGNTLIRSGTTLVINGQVCLVLGPTFVNDGALTGTAAGTRFYFLGGAGPTTYSGTGVVTAPLTQFEVDNVAGVTIDPATVNNIVTSRFNNFAGGLTGSGKLVVGNGGATTASVQLGVAGVTSPVLGFDVAPIFNPGTGGVNLFYAPELGPRTTGLEVPPGRSLNLLSITNPNPIFINGGDLTVTGTAAGTIALGPSRVVTGPNVLHLTGTGVGLVTRTTGRVDGFFRKTLAATGTVTFEVGTANGFSPVTVNATAGTFPTVVTVRANEGPLPNLNAPGDALQRHWLVGAPDVTADLTFAYLDPADLPGTADETLFRVFRRSGPVTLDDLGGTIDTAANTGVVTGLTAFGQFTLAEPGASLNAPPALSAAGQTVRAGDPIAGFVIGTVSDPQQAPETLTVTINGGQSANLNGVIVSLDSVSPAGAVNASITAGCSATDAAFTLRATDAGGLFTESTLNVTVLPNLAPDFSYADTTMVFGETRSITPATGPTDSSGIFLVQITATGTFGGSSSVDTAGVLALGNAAPVGTHSITVRAADNCGSITDAKLNLTVDRASTSLTITEDTPDPTAAGQPLLVRYSLGVVSPGAGTPTGTVTVTDGVDSCVGTIAAGQCFLALTTTGNRTLTASYAGDANFVASNDTEPHNVLSGTDADLSIVKSSSFTLVDEGLVQYTLVVENNGPAAVLGARVQDPLPAALTNATWSCTATNGAQCNGAFGSGDVDRLVDLPVDATVVFAITGEVTLPLPATLENTATVSPPDGNNDPLPANNIATVTDDIGIFADGFEDGAGGSIAAIALEGTGGRVAISSAALGRATGPQAIEIAAYRLGRALIVVQAHRVGTALELRVLERTAGGSWRVGDWKVVDERGSISLDWSRLEGAAGPELVGAIRSGG